MIAVARHTGVWGDTLLSYYVEIVEGSSRIIKDHLDSFMCGGVHKCITKFILVCADVLQHVLFTYKNKVSVSRGLDLHLQYCMSIVQTCMPTYKTRLRRSSFRRKVDCGSPVSRKSGCWQSGFK